MKSNKTIAIIRGENLNKFEMQNYESLVDSYDITAYTTLHPRFEIKNIHLNIKKLYSIGDILYSTPSFLKFPFKGLFSYMGYRHCMFGLENELKDKDILHAAELSNFYSFQAAKVKEKFNSKLILTIWENIPFNQGIPLYSPLIQNIKDYTLKKTDIFVAITKRAKDSLILESIPEEKIKIIPPGINLNLFKPDIKNESFIKELKISENDFIILFIGRLIWQKGIYDLLYSIKKILITRSELKAKLKLIIAGDGPEKKSLIKEISRLDLKNNVIFLGKIEYEKTPELYNIADVFILPSNPTKIWDEQFGMVLIEAMACGIPIISTQCGSIPEVVGDSAILVSPHDFVELSNALAKLIDDAELRKNLRIKGIKRAKLLYDSNKTSLKLNKIYKNLLDS